MNNSFPMAETSELPVPKLHDLQLWVHEQSSKISEDSMEEWEIGVPAKNSLYWSIMMSYLLSDSNLSDTFIKKLIGKEKVINEIKKKKNMKAGKINLKEVQREVTQFNPFKNRHAPFFWPNLKEVSFIFKVRLNRYSNNYKSKPKCEWNDDLKLKAASEMLGCQIAVYFPGERGMRIFGKNPSIKIILFQYKDQIYGSKTEKCNIFRFGMGLQYAHLLKLEALKHILHKAQISKETIGEIKQLMNSPEKQGKGFLPTLLQSKSVDVLPEIYRSPYIVLKLSEAGFETDPTAAQHEKPSPLCYSLVNADRKYIQILYDYASNCRCLFDRCISSKDHNLLDNLRRLQEVLKNDIQKIDCCEYVNDNKERAVDTLRQFYWFTEYQCKTVRIAEDLKKQFLSRNKSDVFQFRKNVIESILQCYLDNFSFNSLNSDDFSEKFNNFLKYTIFYENIDTFAAISFFDNFYALKCCLGIWKENNVLHSEWLLFLAMISNKMYPKYDHYVNCESDHDGRRCEEEKNTLRMIPFLHRIAVEGSFKKLLNELRNIQNPLSVPKNIANDTSSFPQIVDALLISRLQRYINAALEGSTQISSIKHVLAIERALQVIGESLKPPSIKSSVVSFLLCARLPQKLETEFIKIRNDISHFRSNSVYGRLKIEKEKSFFGDMKGELKIIQKAFEIVDFTQVLRIDESIISNCKEQLEIYEPSMVSSFQSKAMLYSLQKFLQLNPEKIDVYQIHHPDAMQLLRDLVIDLDEYIVQVQPNSEFEEEKIGQLKAIEYLLNFIWQYNNDRNFFNILGRIKNFNQQSNAGSFDLKSILKDLMSCILQHLKEKMINLKCVKTDISTSTPKLQNFFEVLKTSEFSSNEKTEIKSAVDRAYEEACEAEGKLIDIFQHNAYDSTQNELESLIQKILFTEENTEKLRLCFQSKDAKKALKYLKRSNLSSTLKQSIEGMIESGSNIDGYGNMLLVKIAFPDRNGKKIYDSVTLSLCVSSKLRNCLTKKAHLLLDRLNALKTILIDDDSEIKAAWEYGKSQGMKYHMEFLMRQRYIRESMVKASLEMAIFDCLNILKRKDLQALYKKSTHLFAGIDLRNIISHHCCLPETVGPILDEDDFPSEMIKKILELVEDTETIKYLLELFEKSGICSRKSFESYIEDNLNLECLKIKKCSNWKSYLSIFPLI